MSHVVRLSPLAIEDLIDLHRWIAAEADTRIAGGYIDRVETRIMSLADHPHRGTSRGDLAPGIRTLEFERRLVIAYCASDADVEILRIFNATRELALLLG